MADLGELCFFFTITNNHQKHGNINFVNDFADKLSG
jgi:hypothetical protein